MIGSPWILFRVSDGGAVKPTRNCGFHTRVSVLHHQVNCRGKTDHFRRFQKDFGVRLGMGDAVAVRHRVKETAQTDSGRKSPWPVFFSPPL